MEMHLGDVQRLLWCANDVPLMQTSDQCILIGPNEMTALKLKPKDYKARAKKAHKQSGFAFSQELDGLRIQTSSDIFFLERVQKPL